MKSIISNEYIAIGLKIILGVFSCALLLSENLRNIPLIAFAVFGAIGLINNKGFLKAHFKILLINSSLFFILLFSIFYSGNIELGLIRVLTAIALLIIPFGFYGVSKSHSLNFNLLAITIYKLFIASTCLFFAVIFIYNYQKGYFNEFFFLNFNERLNTSYGKYSIHPVYASIFVSLSLVFLIPLYGAYKKVRAKLLLTLITLFLSAILILLSRKGIIFATVFVYGVCVSYQKKKVYFVPLSALIMVLIMAGYYIEPIRGRFLELISVIYERDSSQLGSTSIRLNIYECVIQLIKENFIFGYGVGDTKEVLKQCYLLNDDVFNGLYFNTHNQYFGVWLSAGIVAVCSLIYTLYFNLKLAIKNSDIIYISIIILFVLIMLFENILERQNGVILFSFFINFFAFKSQQSNY